MADAGWAALRDVLIASYDDLTRQLTRRLRSSDLAHEALQDTYLRLERGGQIGPIDHPAGYVLRIATNLARDRQRAERRRASAADIEAMLDIADDTPTPAKMAEDKSELAALDRALERLPARRRAIFLAAWKENLPAREMSRRFGVSVRRINVELELAREHCATALKKNLQT
jgi:RNA polymerase sigma-70 factor (ECF subfamily)